MDEHKFCFIICANKERDLEECLWYIDRLLVPEGYEKETIVIRGASSMTSGYNRALKQTKAKYKIYLHQDVLMVKQDILSEMLKIFQDESIGMIGVLGRKEFMPAADYTVSWDAGGAEGCNVQGAWYHNWCDAGKEYMDVVAIDGMFMATQYDLPWDEENFDGWDFYDISQSVNFSQAGYRLVVPCVSYADQWCFHDSGQSEYYEWDRYRKIFCHLYAAGSYVYEPLNFKRLSEEKYKNCQLASEAFERGDFLTANQYVQSLLDGKLDTKCSYIMLFLSVMKDELHMLGKASFSDAGKLPLFIREWNEVKFMLRRIYFGTEDSERAWQAIQDKLMNDSITVRLLVQAINVCVFDAERFIKEIRFRFCRFIYSLISKGEIGKAEQLMEQLKTGECGKSEHVLLNLLSVCHQADKEMMMAVFDCCEDVDDWNRHYIRLERYCRQMEFGQLENSWQEIYNYIVTTGTPDVLLLDIVKKDALYKKKFYGNIARLFAENEGEDSVRAHMYAKMAREEEGEEVPKVNERKFCFIICANRENYLNECVWYLDRLSVPDGYEKELIVIRGAASMANGYNRAMAQTDAKYKIYLQQNALVVNPNILFELLECFREAAIGMAGVLGMKQIVPSAVYEEWDSGVAEVCNGVSSKAYCHVGKEREKWIDVSGIDGMFIATQYDILWDEENFDGWSFYDLSQSMNIRRAGYRIVVPFVDWDKRWVFHDGRQAVDHEWFKYRKIFCETYAGEGHTYTVLDGEMNRKEIEAKRQYILKAFEDGHFEEAGKCLKEFDIKYLDERLCDIALFILVRQEELNKTGCSCFPEMCYLKYFRIAYDELKCILHRMYLVQDVSVWHALEVLVCMGGITMKMLQLMTEACVSDSKKLWRQLHAQYEAVIRSFLRQGDIRNVQFLLSQLDKEPRGKMGNILLSLIQVFQAETERGISPTVFDLTQDADELMSHYTHLKRYLRRLEFSLPAAYWQEVYDYIVQTGVSDYLIFQIFQEHVFNKKEFCLNMSRLFAAYEGQQSMRAALYMQIAESEN